MGLRTTKGDEIEPGRTAPLRSRLSNGMEPSRDRKGAVWPFAGARRVIFKGAVWPLIILFAMAASAFAQRPIAIDYPADGSVFPPEITRPTFLWRDADERAGTWLVEVSFRDGSPNIRVKSAGEGMRIGEIDPEVIAPTNELPKLNAQQAAAHTWIPDASTWAEIKRRSVGRPATVVITGFRPNDQKHAVSRGQITIQTSKDPAGAPIFYRDVPLMPSGEKGVVTPLPPNAMGLIHWRLRNIGESKSRLLMGGLPTCANCHSFSLDGSTLGMDVDGPQNDKGLYALVPVKQHTSIRNEDVIKWSSIRGRLVTKTRAAFMSQVSPDGRYVVTTIDDPGAKDRAGGNTLEDKYYGANFRDYRFLQVFYPTRGILAWYSRESGRLEPLPGADDPRYVQTDGVWSPDGKYIVFARAEAKPPYPPGYTPAEYAGDPRETRIQYDLYRVPFNDGKGGVPEPIAGASRNGMSNNFPKVSPDGRWIVFVKCRNGQLMRPDSQLYIVPAQGGTARRMNCNTPLMNSWHSFSPNGRWLVFASKSRSPYTQMYLTHIDEDGNDSPAILIDNATAANRAVNIPEFVNVPYDGFAKMDAPATDFFRVFDRAADLAKKGQLDAAIPEWKKAVELNPEDGRAHYNLAVVLDQQGRIEEAVPEYRKAVEIEPGNAAAQTNLAVALVRTGKLDEAIGRFTKALEVDPGNARAESNLAAALIEKGRIAEAIEHCRKAIAIDPENTDAHSNLGMALAATGKLDEAVPHLEKALAADPESIQMRYALARTLLVQGRVVEAIPHLEKACRGEDPSMMGLLAAAYAQAGRNSEAAAMARRALEIAARQGNQDLVQALRNSIALYERAGAK